MKKKHAQSERPNKRGRRFDCTRGIFEALEKRNLFAAHIVGSTTVYSTIQAAVDAAAPGATINVDSGTYNETVTINKSLTLRGAQAGVDARNSRGAESIVYATQTVFDVHANDVTIDGFTIEGNDANIGALQGAGVLMRPSIHGTRVLDNIIQNNVTGIYLSNNSNTDQALIQHNLIQNNFETGNNWATTQWNGSRGIYTDGTVSGGYLTNCLIDSNTIGNFNFNAGDEDEGIIALQALTAGKQFNITITNNALSYESKAILATNVTNLVFMGNTVTNFKDGASGPVRFEGNANNVDIQYNSIYGNTGPGVAADSSGVAGDSSGFVVNNNNIYQNDGIGLLTIASVYDGSVTATNDYWGSSTGPSGLGSGSGQAVWANGKSGHGVTPTGATGGSVTFSPWATAMINIAQIPAPASPTSLTASTTSSSQIALNWTAPSSTAISQLVQRSTDGVNFTTIATIPPLLNTFTDTGLTAATAYTYRIIATNNTGNSAPSSTATGTTFTANNNVVPLSSLTWTSATAGYSSPQKNLSIKGNPIRLKGVTYGTGIGTHAASTLTYNLAGQYSTFQSDIGIDDEENGLGSGSVDFQVIGDGVTLFDSGVLTSSSKTVSVNVSVAGVQTLQLVANNGIANNIDYDHADWAGAQLLIAPAAPAAPINLAATAQSQSSISLAWTAVGSNQTGFKIDRSTDGNTWTTINTVSSTSTTYTDTGLTAGTLYYYRVRATNAVGDSANSTAATATTFAIGNITYLSDLSWTSATTGYGVVQLNKSIKGNPITLRGAVYNKGLGTHAASTIAYNLAGQYSAFVADVGVDDEVGSNVGTVDFQVIGDGHILYDSGNVTTTSPVMHLNVGVNGVQTLQLVVNNGIANNIDYDHADWANAQLLGTPSLPSTPTSVTATATGPSSIVLKWTAGGSNQTSYSIDRSSDGTNFTTVATGISGSATTWTDNSVLSASTKYYYRIRANNAAGSSPNSAVVNATTTQLMTVTYISDLGWTTATVGYGTIQKDKSIKGNPLTLNGVTYAKGIGTHAASSITYNLAGKYSTFQSDIGIDDEELGVGTGSVDFQVIADGNVIYDSGIVTGGMPTQSINVSVAGVQNLTLVANNGVPNNIDFDHADWAGAKLLA